VGEKNTKAVLLQQQKALEKGGCAIRCVRRDLEGCFN